MNASAILSTARLSAAAVLGQVGALFDTPGTTYDAVLEIDSEADVPGSPELLRRGQRHAAKVRLGGGDGVRSLCVKIPDAYGPGRDQDFLLASSADGAPMHHIALPASTLDAALYSSLWLYLVGLTPTLFGVQTDGALDTGAVAAFSVSPPVGKFRRIGTVTLGDPDLSDGLQFAARNSGGSIRPLPPVNFY